MLDVRARLEGQVALEALDRLADLAGHGLDLEPDGAGLLDRARVVDDAQRVLGGITTGGIGEIGIFFRIDIIDQHRLIGIAEIDPPDGDGDHLHPGSLSRSRVQRIVGIFSGTRDQSGPECSPGNDQGFIFGQTAACILTTADKVHDFQPVTVGNLDLQEL